MFLKRLGMHETHDIDENLLASISELFLTYGLRSTSMDDISAHLKISKKTLYQTFKNKDHVVEQVMLYRLSLRKRKEVMESISNHSPLVVLNAMKKHIIEDLDTLLPSNYFDLMKYHVEIYKRVSEEESTYVYALLKEIIERGTKQGYFRKEMNISVQIYLLAHQFKVMRKIGMADGLEYPITLLVSTIIDNFVMVISTPKGLKEYKDIM